MLNRLLHNPSVGFAWGVRASAFLTAGTLGAANVLMRTRLANAAHRTRPPPLKLGEKVRDGAYLIAVAGWVHSHLLCGSGQLRLVRKQVVLGLLGTVPAMYVLSHLPDFVIGAPY